MAAAPVTTTTTTTMAVAEATIKAEDSVTVEAATTTTTTTTTTTSAADADAEDHDAQWSSYIASLRVLLRKDPEITSTLEKFIRLTMTDDKRPSVHSYLPVDGPPLETFLRYARDAIVRHMHGRRHVTRPSPTSLASAFAFADTDAEANAEANTEANAEANAEPSSASALDRARNGTWTLAETMQWIASKALRVELRKALQRCRANFLRRERQRDRAHAAVVGDPSHPIIIVDPVPPAVLAKVAPHSPDVGPPRSVAATVAATVAVEVRVKAEEECPVGHNDVEPPPTKKASVAASSPAPSDD